MRRRSLLLPLALVAACIAVPASQVASASTARSFTVTAAWSSSDVYVGDKAVLSGQVKPVRRTKQVLVQLQGSSGWQTVARKSLSKLGKYRYAVTPTAAGQYDYRVKMPRVGDIRSGTSPTRTLSVTVNPVVTFTIPAGTGANPWNTSDTAVQAQVGQTLHLVNADSVAHRPHTNGDPFPHPSQDIPPGGSADYTLATAFSGSLYDHDNPTGTFWITVTAPAQP